jgi:hypothetical protein
MSTMDYASLKLQSDTFANPRRAIDREELLELALSIGRHGLLNRLIVTPTGLIIGGQRRYLAIGLVHQWRDQLAEFIPEDEHATFQERAISLMRVPVDVRRDADIAGLALADNVLRADLSSFEIACHVAAMTETRSCAEVSRLVGKSHTWVSRHRAAYHRSGEALKSAWRDNRIAFDTVLHLSSLPVPDQDAAVTSSTPPPTRAARGPTTRPGIDDVKGFLDQVIEQYQADADPYAQGVIDALHWVTRAAKTSQFAELFDEAR